MEVVLLFTMVIGLLLIGVPIAVSLGLSSMLFLLFFSDATLASVAGTLFEAFEPHPCEPFNPSGYLRQWTLDHAGASVRIASLPGVFAHGRLDPGSALLLDALHTARPQGRVLDFACGAGVVGLALLATSAPRHLTLLDDSALALDRLRV